MKKHIWYMKAVITAPAMVWVAAETEEEAHRRFEAGMWHKVVPNFDTPISWELRKLDYAVVKGPGLN